MTDPLILEMVLQRDRFCVGSPRRRGELAERLASQGMTSDQLNLLVAYHEDRKDSLGDWRGAFVGTVQRDGLWQAIVADLEASPGRGGKAERSIRADLDLSGSGHECMHGTPRGHHCETCDGRLPRGDSLVQMREAQFEHLVRWIMADVRAGKPHPDDTPEVSDQKKARRRRVEMLLRDYLPAPESMERETAAELRMAVPEHLLARRIHPGQRFPGQTVKRMSGAEMSVARWVKEANAASRDMDRTGPLLGHREIAAANAEAEKRDAAPKADAADDWAGLTEGAF